MELEEKSFEKLVEEGAGCVEMGMYGFIRVYEEGEAPCECGDCKAWREIMGKKRNYWEGK